jgi:hypothetical protein
MEPKEQMPQQILGRVFGTSQGDKSVQRRPEGSSTQVLRSPTTSSHLEFVKRTQVLAQEQRVNARVRELMQAGRRFAPHECQQSD